MATNINEKDFERILKNVTTQLQLFADNLKNNSDKTKRSSSGLTDLERSISSNNKLIEKEIDIIKNRIKLNDRNDTYVGEQRKKLEELERELHSFKEEELSILKKKFVIDDLLKRRKELREGEIQESHEDYMKLVDEEIVSGKKVKNEFVSTIKSFNTVIRESNLGMTKSVSNIVKEFGLVIPESLKKDKERMSEIYSDTLLLEQTKNKLAKKRIVDDKENWHLHKDFWRGRMLSLARSIGDSAKDAFFNKTGIIGGAVKLAGKFAGKTWGTGVDDSKEKRLEMQAETLNYNEKIIELLGKLTDTKIGTTQDEKGITVDKNKIKTNNLEVGGMRQDKNAQLQTSKEQTGILKKILKGVTTKQGMGLLAGLLASGLLAIGGLVGFLMTGKSEFLGSLVKGLYKGGVLVKTTLKKVLSLPFAKDVVGALGESIKKRLTTLATPFKFVGKQIGKLLSPLMSVGKTVMGFIGRFGKILSPIKKIGGSVVKGVASKLSKAGLKRIPGIGFLIGLGLAINRFRKGDVIGGLLELASGSAGFLDLLVPGLGFAIGIAIDLYSLSRDIKLATSADGGASNKPLVSTKGKASKLWNVIKKPFSSSAQDELSQEVSNATTTNASTDSSSGAVVNSPNQVKRYIPPSSRSGTNEQISVMKLHPDTIKQVVEGMGKEYGKENGKTSQPFSKGGPSFGF